MCDIICEKPCSLDRKGCVRFPFIYGSILLTNQAKSFKVIFVRYRNTGQEHLNGRHHRNQCMLQNDLSVTNEKEMKTSKEELLWSSVASHDYGSSVRQGYCWSARQMKPYELPPFHYCTERPNIHAGIKGVLNYTWCFVRNNLMWTTRFTVNQRIKGVLNTWTIVVFHIYLPKSLHEFSRSHQ